MYPPEQHIDWEKYWRILVQDKKVVAWIVGASTLIATALAFLITPIYRAEALLAPVMHEKGEGLGALTGQFSELAMIAGINVGPGKDKTAEYVATLRSRSLSSLFIREQNLMSVLFANKWDAENKQWKDVSNVPTEWQAFELWDKGIRRVTQDKRTGLVTLTVDWKDPVLAAQWANELVRHVNTRLRAEAVEDAEKSIAYLEKQLPQTTSVEVQQAIYRLIEAQTKKRMVANTRAEYAFDAIDPAVPPERRYSPRRSLIILGGLVLGVIAALVVAVRRSRRGGEMS
jgi:uncharacterized protein involved in exopolysaccharide biosynthesis